MYREIAKHICARNGYSDLKYFPDGHEAAIMPLAFTHAIIYDLTEYGYGNRWCYSSLEKAREALREWDGVGEPKGWHRHPTTGRRVVDGKEFVHF